MLIALNSRAQTRTRAHAMNNNHNTCNKKNSTKHGPAVVLDALSVSMDMSGMPALSKCLKDHQGSRAHQAWAEELWKMQEPCFRRMWADTADGGGRALMQLMAWEGTQQNELCDMMELHGVLDVTASSLREFMHVMLATLNNSETRTGIETVGVDMAAACYLNVYSEACLEQLLFTNEFLQWQLRFGDMMHLLESGGARDGSS